MWKTCVFLSFFVGLVSTCCVARGDETDKLIAALTERFENVNNLSVESTSTVPELSNPKITYVYHCQWERMKGFEKFEHQMVDDPSRAVTSVYFNGSKTTSVWAPGDVTTSEAVTQGSVRIYPGQPSYDDSMVNAASQYFGLITVESGGSLLDLLKSSDVKAEAPCEISGSECDVWSLRFTMRSGTPCTARIAVDKTADWLPMQWETEWESERSNQTSPERPRNVTTQRRQTVTETMVIVNSQTGESLTIPKAGVVTSRLHGEKEIDLSNFVIDRATWGQTFPPSHFVYHIPDGYRVTEASGKGRRTKDYVQGGAVAEKERLAQIALIALENDQKSEKVVVDATTPQGPRWSLWILGGSLALVVSAIYLRRR